MAYVKRVELRSRSQVTIVFVGVIRSVHLTSEELVWDVGKEQRN